MRVVGFNLTKIAAEKTAESINEKPTTGIEFVDLVKEKTDLLKDGELIKVTFTHSINYGEEKKKEGNVFFEGNISLSVTKDESKDIMKNWKKKKLSPSLNLSLFNLILRRCTPKAIFLEDEVGLPIHTPMPKLQPKKE